MTKKKIILILTAVVIASALAIYFVIVDESGIKATGRNLYIKDNDNQGKNKFYCEKDADCYQCCSNECLNYEWWKKNGPKIECRCQEWKCACIDNACQKK